MIFGVGTDIVEIERIAKLYSKYGVNFANRILNPQEKKQLAKTRFPVKFLAKRFAAKEAWTKALGTGFSNGITFLDMHIEHDDKGKPLLHAAGAVKQLMQEYKIVSSHVSISDERLYATATVILEIL
jgi:holo-[acyl-carrier protein] synthase